MEDSRIGFEQEVRGPEGSRARYRVLDTGIVGRDYPLDWECRYSYGTCLMVLLVAAALRLAVVPGYTHSPRRWESVRAALDDEIGKVRALRHWQTAMAGGELPRVSAEAEEAVGLIRSGLEPGPYFCLLIPVVKEVSGVVRHSAMGFAGVLGFVLAARRREALEQTLVAERSKTQINWISGETSQRCGFLSELQ